jgi:phi13 family phage major tail protein
MEQGICDLYVGNTVDSETGLSASNIRHILTPQEIAIKPKVNTDSAYAANRKVDSAVVFDSADVTMGIYDTDADLQAYLLNQSKPSEGGVVESAEDEADYKCVFYKTQLRRKRTATTRVTRYGWLYKAQFQPWDTDLKTLEGKPVLSGGGPSITGSAQATDFSYVNEKGQTVHPWRWYVDDDDVNCPADIADTWYKFLHVPGADRTDLTVTTAPADEATAVLATASIVWTFNKVVDTSKINTANFVILKTDGSTVGGTLSVDTTGKIVTFKPAEALTSGAAYIAVVTTNVTDAFGLPLALASTINFTVAV